MTQKKERLKPISFYGHKLEDVLRAIMRIDPRKLKQKEAGGAKYFVRESEKKDNQE
jgi:hypothetical protein